MVGFHHTRDTHTVGVLGVAIEGKLVGYLVARNEREKGREKGRGKGGGRRVENEEKERGVRGSGKEREGVEKRNNHRSQLNSRHRGTPTTSTSPCPRLPPNPRAGKSLSLQTRGTRLIIL